MVNRAASVDLSEDLRAMWHSSEHGYIKQEIGPLKHMQYNIVSAYDIKLHKRIAVATDF